MCTVILLHRAETSLKYTVILLHRAETSYVDCISEEATHVSEDRMLGDAARAMNLSRLVC